MPSTRFRVLQFLPHLERAGHRCTVAHSFPPKYDYFPALGWRPSQLLKRAARMFDLLRACWGRYDLVFVERELFHDRTWSMEARFRRVAPAMVLDVDDGVFLAHPEKFDRIARMCEVVIAGNRFIAERVEPVNADVVVIPTCVDTDQYHSLDGAPPSDHPLVVGWMGTTGNLNYLRGVAPALQRLARRLPFVLHLVAPEDTPLASLDLSGVTVRFERWEGAREVEQLQQFDVGIMPLTTEQAWDKYKCGLKLIQYMGVGIPGVASPVGVNAEIVRHGEDGFLATTEREWEECLFQLLGDGERRRRMGAAARRRAEADYSIRAHLPRLIDTFERAVALADRARGRPG